MTPPTPLPLPPGQYMVKREDLLLCLCPVCLNGLNWRHSDKYFSLTATCCCIAHYAAAFNKSLTTYNVDTKPANMENVHWVHRKSATGSDDNNEGPKPAQGKRK